MSLNIHLFVVKVLLANGIKELLLTSDNLSGMNTAPFYASKLGYNYCSTS